MLKDLAKVFDRQKRATADALGTVDELRDRLAALREERDQVLAAPVPEAEALRDLDRWLDHVEASAGLPVRGFMHGGEWPNLAVVLRPGQKTVDASPAIDQLFALMVATNRPAIRALMAAAIADEYEGQAPLDADARASRLREIDGDLDRLEKVEEVLIRQAEALGLPILRRGDARPEVVLAADEALK